MTHLWSCGTASLSPWFLLGFLFGGFLFVFISNRVCRKEKKKENLLFCLTSKQKRLHCPVISWRILRINLAVFRAWAVSSFEMVAADQQLEGINCSELEFIPAGFFFRCMFSSNSLNACHLVRFVLLFPKVVLKVGCSYSTLQEQLSKKKQVVSPSWIFEEMCKLCQSCTADFWKQGANVKQWKAIQNFC